MSVDAGLTTFAEFEKFPDPVAGHYELHHGQVVLMPPRKKVHMQIQQVLFDLLSPLLGGLGFLTIEFAFRPAPEYEAWQCGIGFALQDRWDKDDHEYFLGAPDLVIEVLSASNTMDEILERQAICLANGCRAFWTVDPKRRTVMLTNPSGVTVTYTASSSVPLPDPLPGSIEVAEIFR